MGYGVMIVEEDGTNWVETYRPFNMVDYIVITGSGTKNYLLAAGEQLVLVEGQSYSGGSSAGIGVSAIGGQVKWPVANTTAVVAGEHRVFVPSGAFVMVMKKR